MEIENIKTKEEALVAFNDIKKIIEDFDRKGNNKSVESLLEKRFIELINQGLTLKIKSKNNEIDYFDKDNNRIITIQFRKKTVWFNYSKFWSVFESEFSLNDFQVSLLFSGLVDKHLNYKGFVTHGTLMKN